VIPSVSKECQGPLTQQRSVTFHKTEFTITPLATAGIVSVSVSGFFFFSLLLLLLQYSTDVLSNQKYKRCCQLIQMLLLPI
jgi:hypothetical protein